MSDLRVELSFTFETGEVKTLSLSPTQYSEFRQQVENTRPGLVLRFPIADANGIPGEIFIPWIRVILAEAFIAGEASSEAVAQMVMGFPASSPSAQK